MQDLSPLLNNVKQAADAAALARISSQNSRQKMLDAEKSVNMALKAQSEFTPEERQKNGQEKFKALLEFSQALSLENQLEVARAISTQLNTKLNDLEDKNLFQASIELLRMEKGLQRFLNKLVEDIQQAEGKIEERLKAEAAAAEEDQPEPVKTLQALRSLAKIIQTVLGSKVNVLSNLTTLKKSVDKVLVNINTFINLTPEKVKAELLELQNKVVRQRADLQSKEETAFTLKKERDQPIKTLRENVTNYLTALNATQLLGVLKEEKDLEEKQIEGKEEKGDDDYFARLNQKDRDQLSLELEKICPIKWILPHWLIEAYPEHFLPYSLDHVSQTGQIIIEGESFSVANQNVYKEGNPYGIEHPFAESSHKSLFYGQDECLLQKRKRCILQRLTGGNPDIVTLQECDKWDFTGLEDSYWKMENHNMVTLVSKKKFEEPVLIQEVGNQKFETFVERNSGFFLPIKLNQKNSRVSCVLINAHIDFIKEDPALAERVLKKLHGAFPGETVVVVGDRNASIGDQQFGPTAQVPSRFVENPEASSFDHTDGGTQSEPGKPEITHLEMQHRCLLTNKSTDKVPHYKEDPVKFKPVFDLGERDEYVSFIKSLVSSDAEMVVHLSEKETGEKYIGFKVPASGDDGEASLVDETKPEGYALGRLFGGLAGRSAEGVWRSGPGVKREGDYLLIQDSLAKQFLHVFEQADDVFNNNLMQINAAIATLKLLGSFQNGVDNVHSTLPVWAELLKSQLLGEYRKEVESGKKDTSIAKEQLGYLATMLEKLANGSATLDDFKEYEEQARKVPTAWKKFGYLALGFLVSALIFAGVFAVASAAAAIFTQMHAGKILWDVGSIVHTAITCIQQVNTGLAIGGATLAVAGPMTFFAARKLGDSYQGDYKYGAHQEEVVLGARRLFQDKEALEVLKKPANSAAGAAGEKEEKGQADEQQPLLPNGLGN